MKGPGSVLSRQKKKPGMVGAHFLLFPSPRQRVSLCSPGCLPCRAGCPHTQRSTHLCLWSARIKGVHHHCPLEITLNAKSILGPDRKSFHGCLGCPGRGKRFQEAMAWNLLRWHEQRLPHLSSSQKHQGSTICRKPFPTLQPFPTIEATMGG